MPECTDKQYEVVIAIDKDEEGNITRSLQRIPVKDITNIKYEKQRAGRSALLAKALFIEEEDDDTKTCHKTRFKTL